MSSGTTPSPTALDTPPPPAPPAGARSGPAAGAALIVPALVALTVGAVLGGAAAPLVLGDPGPGARLGVLVSRLGQDLLTAATLGFLLLAAFLTPEAAGTDRRARAARAASWSAAGWAVCALVTMVLSFAAIVGQPAGSPGFLDLLLEYLLQLEVTLYPLAAATLVGVVAVVAGLARTRVGLAWAFLIAVLALWPVALTGHSAGSTDHAQAVNSLVVHLLAVGVWVGGLLALAVLRRPLGRALPVVVARYSTVALWCFLAVTASGVVNTITRLTSWEHLLSPYGALVLAKTLTLGLLGLAGWQQRRRVVRALADEPGSRRVFGRLVLVELLVMGVASGLAVALARTPPPTVLDIPEDAGAVLALTGFPPPPPLEAASWLTVWQPNALYLVVAALAVGLYLAGVARLRRREEAWPARRTVSWVAGWAVFAYALTGAPGVYGHVMLSVHVLVFLTLTLLVPLLLVPAAPLTLASRALPPRPDRTLGPREILLGARDSASLRVLGHPVLACALVLVVLVAFSGTDAVGVPLEEHTGYVALVLASLGSGTLFVRSLRRPDAAHRTRRPAVRVTAVLVLAAGCAALGLTLLTGTRLLVPDFFTQMLLPWVPDPLADQQRAGAVVLALGVPLAVGALAVLPRRRRPEADAPAVGGSA